MTSRNLRSQKALVARNPSTRDPSPASVPTTSKTPTFKPLFDEGENSLPLRVYRYIYNRESRTFCGKTFKNWTIIFAYAIVYLVSLFAYALVFLYVSMFLMKNFKKYESISKIELMTYSTQGIGLSATPTSESKYPLIWYGHNDVRDCEKYITAIDKLMLNKRKRQMNDTNLGPCSKPPYGYGEKPCIIIRINKQRMWKGVPLQRNSSKTREAPIEVQRWLTGDQKLWLLCSGYHSYDKEHIGKIQYYPNPPGFDPNVFPLDMQSSSPIVAVQISEFTIGVSLAIQCQLWYENGPSTVEFMLYVAPGGHNHNEH